MKTKCILSTSLLILAATSSGRAADILSHAAAIVTPSAISTPIFSWESAYFGIQGGYNLGNKVFEELNKSSDQEPKGFTGGAFAGYNFDLGNSIMLGVDADFSVSTAEIGKEEFSFSFSKLTSTAKTLADADKKEEEAKKELASVNADEATQEQEQQKKLDEAKRERMQVQNKFMDEVVSAANLIADIRKRLSLANDAFASRKPSDLNAIKGTVSFKQKWSGSARARVGFLINRMIPYVAGGITYTSIERAFDLKGYDEHDNVLTDPKAQKGVDEDNLIGITLGGGIDFAITDNAFLRTEYRYTDYNRLQKQEEQKYQYKTNEVRIGVAYKF